MKPLLLVMVPPLAALFLACAAGPIRANEPARYREALLAALDLRDQAMRSSGREPLESDALRRAIMAANPDVLATLTPYLPPAVELRDRLARARATLDAAIEARPRRRAAAAKDIAFPEPAPLSDCADASASAAHAMLEAWSVSKGVLAGAKWACLQTEIGINGAELCTALAIETEATETEYELESFCLGAQRDATMTAVAQTQQNVADFLNERADVAVSSRGTQLSIDALQTTLASLQTRLTQLRDAIDSDDGAIALGLNGILDDATGLATQLAALLDDIQDVRFRTQITQINIEDLQDRLADAQAQLLRLADEAALLRTHMLTIQSELAAAQSAQQTAAREQRDRSLAAALGDPDRVVIRYRLPIANGGELERSREVLIRALIAFEALGADTAAARALLVAGDDAYNQGRPLDAYDAYARAYRLLLGTQTATPALIARDSFE
jgi:hypothetical protein